MSRREIFLNFINFYEAIHPAEENSEDAYVWFSSIPHPFLNVVIHLSTKDVETTVDQILQKNVRNNPMTFWLHPENDAEGLEDALRKRKFDLMVTCPVMTWKVQDIPVCEADIRSAEKNNERATFYNIVFTGYPHDDEQVKQECPKLLEKIPSEDYILYEDANPVSTASLFAHGTVGEIFNDATLTNGGVASQEMIQFLMRRAYEKRLERLIVLSYPEAAKLYSDLGFETLFDVGVFFSLTGGYMTGERVEDYGNVEVKKSTIGQFEDGLGAFAKRDFKKGETVIQWKLVALSEEEFNQLTQYEKENFCHRRNGVQWFYPDPERHVNRFTHPNVAPDFEKQANIALRDINEGEELSIADTSVEDF
jgi:hypothetical protein